MFQEYQAAKEFDATGSKAQGEISVSSDESVDSEHELQSRDEFFLVIFVRKVAARPLLKMRPLSFCPEMKFHPTTYKLARFIEAFSIVLYWASYRAWYSETLIQEGVLSYH